MDRPWLRWIGAAIAVSVQALAVIYLYGIAADLTAKLHFVPTTHYEHY